MSLTFGTNIEADTNNARKVGTSAKKFLINDSGNYASFYGTSETGSSTAEKAVTCAEFSDSNLSAGTTIRIKFTYANGVASPTLKINGGTAKNIYLYGTTAPSTSASTSWNSGAIISFTYDGTAWIMDDWLNTDTTSSVDQNAPKASSDTGKYPVIHAYDTNSSTTSSQNVYKAGATYQPSTGLLYLQDKPVVYGDYTSSSAPSSPVTGQIWFKQATMNIDEAKVLVLSATTSSLPTTINDSRITSDMEVMKHEVGNSAYVSGDLTFTVASGSLTISGTLTDSTTIRAWLLRGR